MKIRELSAKSVAYWPGGGEGGVACHTHAHPCDTGWKRGSG